MDRQRQTTDELLKMAMKVISLGGSCTPAWQIRAFTKCEDAFPFDWLVIPFHSIVKAITCDFTGFAQSDSFRLTQDGKGVVNVRYPALHHHDFRRMDDGRIDPGWCATIPQVVQKYQYIVERCLGVLRGADRVLFVRHEGHFDSETFVAGQRLKPEEADDLCQTIEVRYPTLEFNVLFVAAVSGNPRHERSVCREVGWATASDWELQEDRWKGPSRQWQALLEDVAPLVEPATVSERR